MNRLRTLHGALSALALTTVLVVFGVVSACSRTSSEKADDYDEATKKFGVFVSSGRFESADSLVRAEYAAAMATGDSDRWCGSKVHEAVLNYYLYRPDAMLVAIDSATGWLDRQPETPTRMMMLQKVLQAKGTVYSHFYNNPDSAILYLTRGAEAAEKTGNRKEHALALANVADAYKLASRLDMAADFYHRAILEADTAGFTPEDYVSLYGGLATVYTGLRDFNNSAVWWKRTMDLWPRMIPFEKFNNLNNYGTDFYYRRDFAGALKTFKRLDNYLDSLPSADWEKNFVAVNMADCYLQLGMTDSVERLIPDSYRYFTEEQPNPVAVSYLHTLMMRRAWQRGNRAQVEHLIAVHPFSDTLRPEMQLLRLEFLSDYYGESGNPVKALDSYRRFKTLEDSIRSVAVSQSIAANRMAYERDRSVLSLKAENALQEGRIMRLLAIIGFVIALLLVIVGAVLVNRRRVLRREEKMLAKIAALRTETVRSRITPHFIYNALNHEIRNRDAGRESRLEAIVSLLRHQQFVASDIVTTLDKELEFTDNYISVQSDNYEGRFDYIREIADGLDPERLRIPSMFIQILVENAFKHAFPGVAPDETCRLMVCVRQPAPDRVTVSVFNTTPPGGGTALFPSTGTGLRVIMETIRMIRERDNVEIAFNLTMQTLAPDGSETGCLATYTIPLKWMEIEN